MDRLGYLSVRDHTGGALLLIFGSDLFHDRHLRRVRRVGNHRLCGSALPRLGVHQYDRNARPESRVDAQPVGPRLIRRADRDRLFGSPTVSSIRSRDRMASNRDALRRLTRRFLAPPEVESTLRALMDDEPMPAAIV